MKKLATLAALMAMTLSSQAADRLSLCWRGFKRASRENCKTI